MTRKRATEKQIVMTLIASNGAMVPCGICQEPISFDDVPNIERDHIVPLALGGEDAPCNWHYVHGTCHRKKTNGKPATSYGSDKHAIAKDNRINKRTKQGPKKKIQSRGFGKPPEGYVWWPPKL